MHPNAHVIQDFYAAFARGDAEGMVACYAPDVEFSDPIFPSVTGAEARAMWRMLLERPVIARPRALVEASGIEADETSGKACWEATFTLPTTGRRVKNRVEARFTLRNGKIVRHQDSFSLWSWTGQALGVQGRLFGWLPPFQRVVRRSAREGLRDYLREHGG